MLQKAKLVFLHHDGNQREARKVRRPTFCAVEFLKTSGERGKEKKDKEREGEGERPDRSSSYTSVHTALVKRRSAIPRDIVPVLNQVPLPPDC